MSDESFNKIDYRLRPAKNVERKLLAEALARLARVAPLENWCYVGFGSVYFADFVLFHKTLGLKEMFSVEQSEHYRDRVLFNKPYGYVGMLWGTAAQKLPSVDWDKRTIVWLDYDSTLDGGALADLATIATNSRSGSAIVATLDVDPKRVTDEWLEDLRSELGSGLVPSSMTAAQLKGPRGPLFVWKLADRAIREAVRVRNQSKTSDEAVEYRQLFNFVYNDGSRMLTLGGLLVGPSEAAPLSESGVEGLWFVRKGSDPLELSIPKLTFKEMKALDRCMPWGPHSEAPPPALPSGAVEQYAQIYRYFPAFVEAEF